MRLWSIHPKYLDKTGLLALWRESLLAQKVLKGKTKGYVNHPQLTRFKNHTDPLKAIANYLSEIWKEASKRGYNFNKRKIGKTGKIKKIKITNGQLECEFNLLLSKLKMRDPGKYKEILFLKEIECNPVFMLIEGRVENWERAKVKTD